MKKYLLIPALLLAAIVTANAHNCAGKKECESECKKECCSEKSKCCGGEVKEGKSCCSGKKESAK